MIIYKKNQIVGWINIVLGILGCTSWFICWSCVMKMKEAYLSITDEQYSLANILLLLIAIPFVLTFIINLIYIFKNWHNKKSMVLNIIAIISIIISAILILVFKFSKGVYIASILVILGILLLIFNKNEEQTKKHIVLFVTMIINIILLIISSIGFICIKNDFKISYINNEKNLIKNIIQESNGLETSTLILARKNGKHGVINQNGKNVINFDYGNSTRFIEVENKDTNKKYYMIATVIGNELKVMTNNKKQIASYKNTKQKHFSYFWGDDFIENLKKDAQALNANIEIKNLNYGYLSEEAYTRVRYQRMLSYNSNGILSFDISSDKGKKVELKCNTKTGSITHNGKEVGIEGSLKLYKKDTDTIYLDVYKNGYIPIYNFNKEIFGWIDLMGQTHYINGRKQILDFSDKYIAVKDYSVDADAKVCIVNYNGEVVSEYYKEINILDKGFVVKKQNGKNVYLDENLKQSTQEYDIIDVARANDGILIVANLETSNLKDIHFDLININNGQIIGKYFEYIDGLSLEIYGDYALEDVTYDELKKIMCSVDCKYLNTELYEKYYK